MLHCVSGTMGIGKTLSMTYLGYKEQIKNGTQIYANYHLDKKYFPNYILITSFEEFCDMKEGMALMDELWLSADSRESHTEKNKVVSKILATGRKKQLVLFHTTQHPFQIDNRIRTNTHTIFIPLISSDKKYCTLTELDAQMFYNGITRKLKSTKFETKHVFKMYDTLEEVQPFEVMGTLRCVVCNKKAKYMFNVKDKVICSGCKKSIEE